MAAEPVTAHDTLALLEALIARASVTPDDAGCQDLLVEALEPYGFRAEWMNSGPVRNLWLRRGDAAPLFVFAGHTDVVPTGPLAAWRSPPFEPSVRDGYLYGRGAADMKSSIAAFVTACRRLLARVADPSGSIALLITSDEEGPSVEGTVHVMRTLSARDERIDWCLVGEPSSSQRLGDVVRVGRRGSLNGRLVVEGVQGHVAYPDDARNPIHAFAPVAAQLAETRWDDGNAFFPATSFQFSNVRAGTGASNVIPGELAADFNFRYSSESTRTSLEQRVHRQLDDAGLRYRIEWTHSGEPFLTEHGELIAAVRSAIKEHCGIEPELNTAGGTSDGRFIAPSGAQVVELGHVNATIHKLNERVRVADIETLSHLYESVVETLLARDEPT